jgi:ABC-type lipoprotein export system ATPase subunit
MSSLGRRGADQVADVRDLGPVKEQEAMVLQGRGLSKSYANGAVTTTALHACDVEVTRGEVLAIVGPSGSGKSTLLHLLAGLDQPTEGDVHLDGQDLGALDDAEAAGFRARHIGIVLQRANLIPSLTVRENVGAPLMLSGTPRAKALERADEMLGKVDLAHRGAAFPGEVSGGEAQRAAVARACIASPAMVFADEPTGAVDQSAGQKVMDLFVELVQATKAGMIIVTHDPAIAERGDSVLRLLDGRRVE